MSVSRATRTGVTVETRSHRTPAPTSLPHHDHDVMQLERLMGRECACFNGGPCAIHDPHELLLWLLANNVSEMREEMETKEEEIAELKEELDELKKKVAPQPEAPSGG